ncbi:Rv1733c family protein [Actinomadura roseirufa]|uniref:Rv1733c family protein n=1 Tax=Actinomadura roseirufa TaxID=2094049 RepID=UPI001041B881|nr:hypothetical protein [Actinomadura roseirufa]
MKRTGPVTRWRRRYGFDRNDLRREVDRVQWLTGLLLLVAALVTVPPLSLHAGRSAYASGTRAERAEAAHRHRVDATVVKATAWKARNEITVTWDEPRAVHRTGTYTTWRAPGIGEHPKIWVGPGGPSDRAPRPHSRTIGDTVTAGAGTAMPLGAPPLGAYLLVRRRCDRRRHERWDAEWEEFDRGRIGH